MEDFRLLVTGSRTITPAQADYVRMTLNLVHRSDTAVSGPRPMVVIQGECPYGGVDLVAKQWADSERGVMNEGYPADWEVHGKGAGMIRNSQMVATGADLCLAFPIRGSKGTWDCLRKAVDAGIHPRVYPLHILVS